MAVAAPSEKIQEAIADWIAFTYKKKLDDEAPLVPEKVKAGELVRISPPIEEYSSLERNISRAEESYPYFKDALENPEFDINKLYALSQKD